MRDNDFDWEGLEESWKSAEPDEPRCERKFHRDQCFRKAGHRGPHRTRNTSWYEPGEMEKQGLLKKRSSKASKKDGEKDETGPRTGRKKKAAKRGPVKKSSPVTGSSKSTEKTETPRKTSKKSSKPKQEKIRELARLILGTGESKEKLD